ncbi:MAG: hypothetical protein ACLUP8_05755 [Ruminococcus sp.]|uniref:hypothetical protein n=1 Tax=Ruminococcus sp. TaxID=41978 RepID=UPI003992025E
MNSRRLFDKFKEELLEKNNIKIVSTISENGYPSIAFRNCLFANLEDEIILLEPVETSVNNRNLTYSIWFNKKVLIALWNFEGYGLLAYATIKRVIISGKEFEKYYELYLNDYRGTDLAAVWVMAVDNIVETGEKIEILQEQNRYSGIGHLDRFI